MYDVNIYTNCIDTQRDGFDKLSTFYIGTYVHGGLHGANHVKEDSGYLRNFSAVPEIFLLVKEEGVTMYVLVKTRNVWSFTPTS